MALPMTVVQCAGPAGIRPGFEARAIAWPRCVFVPAKTRGLRLNKRVSNDFLGRQLTIKCFSNRQRGGKIRAATVSSLNEGGGGNEPAVERPERLTEEDRAELAARIASGEFTAEPATVR